jgi:hypothetical protein
LDALSAGGFVGNEARRSDLLTILAIAIAAYALCDLVHEVLGHGVAVAFVPGVRAISLSSVALQTTGISRIVAAAGSLANLVAGAVALTAFRRFAAFTATAYFLWLFGAINLLDGAGNVLYAPVLGSGDWAFVVRGASPAWLWRVALGLAGAVSYLFAIAIAVGSLGRAVRRGLVSRDEIPRLVVPAYLSGGVLLVLASLFNPVGPSLVLLSGVAAGFGAMAGLLAVPWLVERWSAGIPTTGRVLGRSVGWIVVGVVISALFVAVIGPGVRF